MVNDTNQNSARQKVVERIFRIIATSCAALILMTIVGILIELFRGASLSIRTFGLSFLISQQWNPVIQMFGAGSSIFGTIVTTLIAMILAVPMSLILALFLTEIAPPIISRVVGYSLELLAAIPSIIYGMWGLFVFAPLMSKFVQPLLGKVFGFLPLFKGSCMGIGMLTAGLILALMILPFISAVMRDVFLMVPPVVKESAFGMGATTWEVTSKVTMRFGAHGLIGASFLGLGRAIGETMAVTFVIGNDHKISLSLFSPGNTIASTIANEFTEASEPLYKSSLIELGLILFLITLTIQILAHFWLKRIRKAVGNI